MGGTQQDVGDANNKNWNKMYEFSSQIPAKVLPCGSVSCYCCIFLASPHKNILIVWLLEGHFIHRESFD